MNDKFNRLLAPLANRIGSLLGVGKLTRVDPGSDQQCQVEMLEGELRDKLPHSMLYGFQHVPLPGAEAFAVFLRGDKSGGIVIQISDPRYSPTLEPGEVALYDDQAQTIHIARDGIYIQSDKKIVVEGKIELTGEIHIEGECKINGITQTGD